MMKQKGSTQWEFSSSQIAIARTGSTPLLNWFHLRKSSWTKSRKTVNHSSRCLSTMRLSKPISNHSSWRELRWSSMIKSASCWTSRTSRLSRIWRQPRRRVSWWRPYTLLSIMRWWVLSRTTFKSHFASLEVFKTLRNESWLRSWWSVASKSFYMQTTYSTFNSYRMGALDLHTSKGLSITRFLRLSKCSLWLLSIETSR